MILRVIRKRLRIVLIKMSTKNMSKGKKKRGGKVWQVNFYYDNLENTYSTIPVAIKPKTKTVKV